MAPKRRTTSTRSAGPAQSTLSFHGRSSKVSKPTAPPSGIKAGKEALEAVVKPDTEPIHVPEAEPEEKPATATIHEDEIPPAVAPVQPLGKADQTKAQDEDAAKNIPESKIKSYWQAKEKERKAPRIHQQSLSMNEKILREWDTNARFGPNIGIPRLRRWHRAKTLGLNPPVEVLAVLVRELEATQKKDKSSVESNFDRAYMDELLNASSLAE